jgi:hypothetical protein
MKAKDIENEMRRIAEEGKELQEKLAIIESLHDVNNSPSIDWEIIGHDVGAMFSEVNYVTLRCKKSGACVIVGSKHPSHEIDGKWRWYTGPFKGLTVEEVYEIEDTDPIPQPPLVKEPKESTTNYEMIREVDEQGVHRTKVVPKGSEGDDNKHGEDED